MATFAMSIGGLTRTIINWVRKDRSSRHSLILTRQDSAPIPSELVEAVQESGGAVTAFPAAVPLLDRASWLRQLAPRYGDLVVLHLVPHDVVPIVAFAAEAGVPVSQVNLADQCYWLGSTVADSTINLRDVSSSINDEFRFTRNEVTIPIPLQPPNPLTRAEARGKLGISESECVLLTVGRAIKYAPSRRQSFFQTANKILAGNPGAHLYAIGVSADDHSLSSSFVSHDRMHLLGPIDDPSVYQRAADVYLEGFPFGSQTALLESVLPGVPCVRTISPLNPVLAASDIAIDDIAPVPNDETSYVELAGNYVSDTRERREAGRLLADRVFHFHVGTEWNSNLEDVYARIEVLRHAPCEIPSTAFSKTPADFAVSEYHGTRFSGPDPGKALEALVRKSILGCAYSLRQSGAYTDSLRMIRMSNYRRWWWDTRSIQFAAKLIPHKLLRTGGFLTVE